MNKIFIVLLLVVLVFSFAGCAVKNSRDGKINANSNNTKIEYKSNSPSDAKKRLDTEKGVILLDVRTAEEYTEKHIPGSILIPVDVIDKEAQSKLTDKAAPIFVYCQSGRRSVTASESLVKQGYTNVFNLGGINDWPYETEAGDPK